MCGGIVYQMMKMPKGELAKYYTQKEIDKMIRAGKAQSFFWDKQPILPIDDNGNLRLVAWGNRDKEIKFPKTGWAKKESIDEGKWAYLKPKVVTIPAEKGYEKGVWFDVDGQGFQGLLVRKGGVERAYMITQRADADYLKMTKHDRQPIIVKQ